MYLVPVVISDGGTPLLSSTNTLTVRVCTCDRDGNMQLCNAEALSARAGLSTGALVAILLCSVILLSEEPPALCALSLHLCLSLFLSLSLSSSPSP